MHFAVNGSDRTNSFVDCGARPEKVSPTSDTPLGSEKLQMHISSLITAFALLATLIAGAVWLVPPQREAPALSVMLSNSILPKACVVAESALRFRG